MHQILYAGRYRQCRVPKQHFLEIQDSGGRRCENTQKGIFWPILEKFAPNLCADKYGEYKGHKRPIIALSVNSRWRQHFWELKTGWPPS